MKKIPLGTTDITLSRMGLGTWAIGGGPAWNGDLDRPVPAASVPSEAERHNQHPACANCIELLTVSMR